MGRKRGVVVLVLLAAGCVEPSGDDYQGTYETCTDHLIMSPTMATTYATSGPLLPLGGHAASDSCDAPDRAITVTVSNITTSATQTVVADPRCEQVCPFTGCTAKTYYWYAELDLSVGANQVEAMSSGGLCSELTVRYTPATMP